MLWHLNIVVIAAIFAHAPYSLHHPSNWASPKPGSTAPPALYDIETAFVAAVPALAAVPFPTTKMKSFIKHSIYVSLQCCGALALPVSPKAPFRALFS
ncbi:hypothetical protein R3P38DRAFT_3218001 [Favolaschia claudopus]|uniref:Secreted protein n=1 Tax=Favolaschia claudopus TaxID=2862362 RepID=A0AAW0A3S9_9AGAR